MSKGTPKKTARDQQKMIALWVDKVEAQLLAQRARAEDRSVANWLRVRIRQILQETK